MLLERTWMGSHRLLARLLLVILLGGCAVAAEQGGKQLRLGYFPNPTHAQALYARATGAFDKVGARIQWVAFNAGPTAIEALFTDAVDATFVGPSPTINGYIKSKGDKFVVVAGSASGGAGLVVRGDSGITTAKDFGGKVIATPQLGNTQDIAARVWLPFAEALLKCWLAGIKNSSREIFICPELGPAIGGYALSTFPNSWEDAKILRVEIDRLWKKLAP